MMRSFRLASGNDSILLRQAARVERAIEERSGEIEVALLPVGDPGQPPGVLDALGSAVLRGAADAAVCPAGVLSSGLPPGLEVGAIYRDGDPAYRWISCGRPGPGALPHGARVVTWDDVSRAQILYRFPSLQVESVRGWTRVFEGLRQGTWGAACLPPEVIETGSLWGLDWGLIAPDEVMPAIGQGAAAILVASGSSDPLVGMLNDRDTERRLRLESIFWWNAMEVPSTIVTAHATIEGGVARLEGIIAEAEGMWLVSDGAECEEDYGAHMTKDVAQSCLEMAWRRRNRGVMPLAGRVAS